MPGRKKKPTAMRAVIGTERYACLKSERAARREIEPPVGVPEKTDALSAQARLKFDHLSTLLCAMGVLTVADGDALALLAESMADADRLRAAMITLGGSTYETVSVTGALIRRAHPEFAQLADTERRILALLAHFGLTPSARTKVNVAPGAMGAGDPANRFFG